MNSTTLHLHRALLPTPKTHLSRSKRPILSLSLPSNPISSSPPLSLSSHRTTPSFLSLLKPACILLAVKISLFSGLRHPPPALAITTESETREESETLLEEHLQSNPEDKKSLRALLNLKIKAQKLNEAVEIIDKLIILEPGQKDLVLLKAHMQSFEGDTENARKVFEEMLEKDPLFVEAYHGLVMAASGSDLDGDLSGIVGRVEAAMEICVRERKKEELRDFKLLLAQVKVMEGVYDEALKLYQELVREEPRDFRPYLCQGIIYTLLRRKDEADKQFEKYRRLVPKGHPYAQYFDESMKNMNIFDGSTSGSVLQR